MNILLILNIVLLSVIVFFAYRKWRSLRSELDEIHQKIIQLKEDKNSCGVLAPFDTNKATNMVTDIIDTMESPYVTEEESNEDDILQQINQELIKTQDQPKQPVILNQVFSAVVSQPSVSNDAVVESLTETTQAPIESPIELPVETPIELPVENLMDLPVELPVERQEELPVREAQGELSSGEAQIEEINEMEFTETRKSFENVTDLNTAQFDNTEEELIQVTSPSQILKLPKNQLPKKYNTDKFLEKNNIQSNVSVAMVEAWRSLPLNQLQQITQDSGLEATKDKTILACQLVSQKVPFIHMGKRYIVNN
jgi:hypothetical protein